MAWGLAAGLTAWGTSSSSSSAASLCSLSPLYLAPLLSLLPSALASPASFSTRPSECLRSALADFHFLDCFPVLPLALAQPFPGRLLPSSACTPLYFALPLSLSCSSLACSPPFLPCPFPSPLAQSFPGEICRIYLSIFPGKLLPSSTSLCCTLLSSFSSFLL